MKIYGYQLTPLPENRWLSKFDFEDLDSPDGLKHLVINSEEEICEACHLYEDSLGNQYIGFDLKLGMSTLDMDKLLSFHKSGIYKVRKL